MSIDRCSYLCNHRAARRSNAQPILLGRPGMPANGRLRGLHACQSWQWLPLRGENRAKKIPSSLADRSTWGRIASQSHAGNTILHDVQRIRQYFEVTWIVGSGLEHALKNWTDRILQPLGRLGRNGSRVIALAWSTSDSLKRRPTNSVFRSAMTISAPKARASDTGTGLTRPPSIKGPATRPGQAYRKANLTVV